MRYLLSLLCLMIMLIALPSFSQNTTKIDSLLSLLKKDKEDTNKVNHLNTLGWELKNYNPDSAILVGNQSLYLAENVIFTQSKSQSNDFGIISGNVGANFGINAIALEKTGVTAYAVADVAAIMTHFPIELNFGLFKPLSIGANFSPSRWHLIDEGIISGKFASWGLNINLYPINKNRFNMQLSLTPSLLTFKTFSFAYDQNNRIDIDLEGTAFKTRLLFNIYFSDNAGMYFDLGYSSYKIGIKNYSLLIQDPDLETEIKDLVNQGFNLRLPGVQAGIGVVFKLNNSLSKK